MVTLVQLSLEFHISSTIEAQLLKMQSERHVFFQSWMSSIEFRGE